MCGIAAVLKLEGRMCPAATVDRMRDEVSYRGPDAKGAAFFAGTGERIETPAAGSSNWALGLGHRRLSILGLSPSGHQPMCYGGRFWISYNGEVYNYVEIREELSRAGHLITTATDTEVLLAAFAEWGPACFERLRGMWGLVLYDSELKELIVCRDRLGIKPLYVWKGSGLIAFASEIKQFLQIPGFHPQLNDTTALQYLHTGYEDPSCTFFADVDPVPAAHWLRVSLATCKVTQAEEYWHPERVRPAVTNPLDAAAMFSRKVKECVRMHLRSDVPTGCALSGGLDSSTIATLVAAEQKSQAEPVRTFTATFPGEPIDEWGYAESVASAVGAQTFRVTPDPQRFLQDLDRFIWIHDEPVGSLSMYAGYCVSRLTRESGVTVSLHGQGGDEILSGYWQSYFLHLRSLLKTGRWYSLAKQFGGALGKNGNNALWEQIPVMFRRYISRARSYVSAKDRNGMLHNLMCLDEQQARVYQIRTMFLPRLLKWDDRNSMAFSVEGRYPFLDHELIDLCLSFSSETLYRFGWTKLPLRLAFQQQLPRKVAYRTTKFGFETPQNAWLRGPLRHWVDDSLHRDRPLWDYVNRERLNQLSWLSRQPVARAEEAGQAVFRALIFDRWLELFGVSQQRSTDVMPNVPVSAIS